MSKEDLPSIEDFIDENLPSVEDFIEEGKDNLPSLDSLVENNILPSIEDIPDNEDLPSVEDFTEILNEETVSIEDAEGNTFAEIEDIIPPWPELLKIINDVRDQIPDIPEIKYYDAELEKLCEIVDEIRSEIPEVKYYDAEVEAICEQIDSVRDAVSNLPEVKYYDEYIDAIESRINIIKEDIENLPEPKYYDEDLQSIREEIEVVRKEFPWIEANFKGIVEDFEKVRDSIGTVEEKVNLELDSILETIDVKAFENKVLTNEVRDIFENDKKKICEEIKESSQKIFDLHKEFKDDDRKLKKQIKGEYDKLKQSVQEQLEKYNQESVKTDELLLKYFTDLREEIDKLPEVKYYDSEIKSLRTSVTKSIDRFSPIESDIKSIYKIVEDIKKTQIELNEQIINEPSEVNQDIGAGKDPLTPIDQKFATLDDLSKHYQLFVTRIQQQLSTIGGGGAGYIKDLSDVVFDSGIGTNKLLIYDGTKWVGIASTALGSGGGGGGSQDLNSVLTNGNTSSLGIGVGFVTATFLDVSGITTLGSSNGIGTVTIGVGSTALFVDGNARITGILSVGQGTITIDGDANTVTATTFNGSFNGNVTGSATGLSGTPDITVRNVSVTGVTTFSGAATLESTNYLQLKDSTNIIGHNGSNNLFRFTDSLQFRGDTLFFQEYDGTEYMRLSEEFGVQLKHQGSTKLQIESDGINVTGTTETDQLNVTGVATASSFVKSSGTSSQFLKADGSVDSNTYLTSYTETQTLNDVTSLGNSTSNGISVGVATATSFVKSGGTSSQFLKADGSVDSNTYLTSYTETQTLDDVLTLGNVSGIGISVGVATASSFVKSGGSSSEFLKADGSVDSSTYLTSETQTLDDVTSLGNSTSNGISVGVATATSFIKSGGTSSQFLKADGSVDSNTYLTSETDTLDDVTSRGNSTSNSISVGVVTATALHTGAEGSAIRVTSDTISGPANLIIDPAGIGDNTGIVRIKGDLYVDGTEFIVNSSTIELADLKVGIATTVGTNLLLDGGGIGIGSASVEKTILWNNSSTSLKSSENWDLASGKVFKINGTEVLSATSLTITNVNASGIVTATTFVGNLTGTATTATNLADGANITTGTISDDRLPDLITSNINITTGVSTVGTLDVVSVVADRLSVSGVSTFSDDISISDKIVHTGDTDTAIRFPDANTITVETAGSERVRVSAGGSVGVGTDNPSQKLDVNGDIRLRGAIYDSLNSTGTSNQVLVSNAGAGVTWKTLSTIPVGDASTLDGLDSTQFLRSDVADTKSGITTFSDDVILQSNLNVTGVSTFAADANFQNVSVGGTLSLSGAGSQFFAYNEDTIKVKFANWYSSNDRQYGMGQLWFETWFAAIDNNPTLRDNRRIGFYLEEPNNGSSDSGGTSNIHPTNDRMHIDINGVFVRDNLEVSGGANIVGVVTATTFVGDGVTLNNGFITTGVSTTTATDQTSIDSFSASTYRSAKYNVQITRGSEYQTTEISVIHDGSDSYGTEYATIRTGTTLATFSTDISEGNVRLLATPSSATSTVFKLFRTTTEA